MVYESSHDLLQAASDTVVRFYDEARGYFPNAELSHIGFRCADENEYNHMVLLGGLVGTCHHKGKDGHPITFVKLHDPLRATAHTADLHWLEIIAPKPEQSASGPRLLVFFMRTIEQAIKITSKHDTSFTLRFQGVDVPTILGFTP